MASRLSEIPDWKILLLEAGPDENEISDVPALAAFLQLSRLDWQYKTEPTGKACLGMKGTNRNISRHSSLSHFPPSLSPPFSLQSFPCHFEIKVKIQEILNIYLEVQNNP